MGLFDKTNVFKPGKGVEKNARKKNAFFRFFEVLYRKFSNLFALNIVYALCISPIICAVVFMVVGAFSLSREIIEGSFLITYVMKIILIVPRWISIPLLLADVVFFGPLTAGFTYMLRNHATERHAWFSDFFSRSMENFKQGFIHGMIDVVVFISLLLYLTVDLSALKGSGMYYFYVILKYAACLIAVVYVFMRYYTYTIMVSFDLPFKGILKNALIFTVLGFFPNVIATVAIVASVFAFTSTWIIDAVLLLTFTLSFCGFIGMYCTYPIIKKYMMPEENEECCEDDLEDEGSDEQIEE